MKKILLLIFLSILIIIPAGSIYATQYYVGVTIASAQAPGYPSGTTNSNWCLPNKTTMAIRNNSGIALTAISPTSNPVIVSSPICAGNTLWSGLFDLTSGTDYQIYIYPTGSSANNYYYSYCPGVLGWTNSYCWVAWQENKNCAETCAHFGSVIQPYNTYTYNYQNNSTNSSNTEYNCGIESILMGSSCSSCTAGATYNYYNASSKSCYYSQTYYNSNDTAGSVALPGYVRACPCYIQNNNNRADFTFTFTPNF
jgi:hypothetical protein